MVETHLLEEAEAPFQNLNKAQFRDELTTWEALMNTMIVVWISFGLLGGIDLYLAITRAGYVEIPLTI